MMTLLFSWKKSWSAYGTPSRSEITSEGSGRAKASTRSVGLGPASISSIRSSAICCTAGRMASIRLIMNGAVTMRRRRACSGSSMRMNPMPGDFGCSGSSPVAYCCGSARGVG